VDAKKTKNPVHGDSEGVDVGALEEGRDAFVEVECSIGRALELDSV